MRRWTVLFSIDELNEQREHSEYSEQSEQWEKERININACVERTNERIWASSKAVSVG